MNNDPQFDQASLLPVGAFLRGGKYRVDRYLSSGNFGNTYIVTDMASGVHLAMKEFYLRGYCYRTNMRQVTMSPAVSPERINQHRDKFKKEAFRMKELKGDHVVHIYDLFDENNTSYYVMDYVQGESLASYMEHTGKPLTEEQTLYILDQLLDGLEEVHKEKIWHLDLKPDNIMIDRNGKVVIIDFGASKQLGDSGKYTGTTGVLCYTPGYAPIEQMSQDMASIGPWTDIYALGATLYNLLTNITPTMQGPDTLRYPIPVSKKTRDLISWMMSMERTKRPQSIAAIRGFLNFQNGGNYPKQKVVQQKINNTPANNAIDDDEHTSSTRKWIYIACGGAVALVIVLLLLLSGGNKDDRYYWDGAEDVEEVVDSLAYLYDDDAVEAEEAVADDYQSLYDSNVDEVEEVVEDVDDDYDYNYEEEVKEEEKTVEEEVVAAPTPSVVWNNAYLEHNVLSEGETRQMMKAHFNIDIKNNVGHTVKVYMYVYREDGSIHQWANGGNMYSTTNNGECNWETTHWETWVGIYNDSLNLQSGQNYYVMLWVKDETTGEWLSSSSKLTFYQTE